jgi:hypothetical protein
MLPFELISVPRAADEESEENERRGHMVQYSSSE